MDFRQNIPYAFNEPQAHYDFHLYSDGAYFKQCRLGGWGVAIYNRQNQLIDTLSGVQISHSSLEMELIAAIQALEWLHKDHPDSPAAIFTDAQILLEGLFDKYPKWQQNDWRSPNGNPVVFAELWQQLCALTQNSPVDFYWIKGHANHSQNQLADQLAREKILNTHSA